MNYYIDILSYYKENPDNLKSIHGSLKKGYIALCVYYALLYIKINITKESLVEYFRYSLSDLFEANKNMKRILKLPPTKNIELCGMKNFLNENFETGVINQIQKIIGDLSLSNPKYIAAAVYYVTSVPISKGGIYSKKLKTKNGDYLTLEFISTFCKVVPSTISSAVKEIIAKQVANS